MAAVTALWPVAAWRSPWLIIPFQCLFLTTIAHHVEIQMYMALGNIPLELNLTLCVSGMLRHLLFAYDIVSIHAFFSNWIAW